jgi:hypothetical protein
MTELIRMLSRCAQGCQLDAQADKGRLSNMGFLSTEYPAGPQVEQFERFRLFFAAPNYASGRQAHLETVPGVEVHCVEF